MILRIFRGMGLPLVKASGSAPQCGTLAREIAGQSAALADASEGGVVVRLAYKGRAAWAA